MSDGRLELWLPIVAIAISFIQGLLMIVWLTHISWQSSYVAGQQVEISRRVQMMDELGGRAVSASAQRIQILETQSSTRDFRLAATETSLGTITVEIGKLSVLVQRLDEQQMRILQALDSMYDKQQEHVRDRALHPSAPAEQK
jgi:hypothetical protein